MKMNSSQLRTNENRSKTFFHTSRFPIQCFALNNNGNRVIVAGKNDWELLTIGENSFHSNYAINRNIINLRIMDTCWSRLDESLVVSCGSNGELYKLIVSESEILIEQPYKFHERAINKIHFHPHEPSILISGGQDGIIKLTDFRIRDSNAVSIFKHDAEDKVTDIQFNPSLSMSHQFASGSENGLAFTWDKRVPNKYERRFNAHLGRVHLDWHPEEKYWLATASVDKQICVWDLSLLDKLHTIDKITLINSLTHSESVTSIQWRPKRRTQITACSTVFDSHLYVWDLMRPYVPYASFDSSNKYSKFVWKNSACILASNRLQLYNTYISEAIRPTEHSTLVSVNIDKYGSVAFAVGVGEPKGKDFKDDLSVDSDVESEKFKITKSVLYIDDQIKNVRLDWFYYSATNYKFKGLSFDELCDYNANIAYKSQKFNVYKDWMIFKTMYKETDNYKLNELNNASATNENQQNNNKFSQTNNKNINIDESNLNKPILNDTSNVLHISVNSISNSNLTTNIITSSTSTSAAPTPSSSDSASDDSLLGSNVNLVFNNENKKSLKERTSNTNSSSNMQLSKANSKTKVNQSNENQINNYFNSNDLNIEHNEDDLNSGIHLINKFDDEEDNFLLPSDIIEYNDDLNDYFMSDKNQLFSNDLEYQLRSSLNSNIESSSSASYTKKQLENLESFKNQLNQPKGYKQIKENSETLSFNFGSKNLSSANTFSNEAYFNNEEKFLNFINYRNQINILDENNLNLGTAEEKLLNFDSYFCDLLLNYIDEQNDLTTAIFMFLVASLNKKIDQIKIETAQLDEWFSQYIELLSKFELWNLRTEIIKIYQSDFIKNLTQKSINYNIMCSTCKKNIKQGTFICSSCNKNAFLCTFCHLPVKRLYVWCHNCCHGGHVNHMIKWFKNYSKCPSGCGCNCVTNYQINQH